MRWNGTNEDLSDAGIRFLFYILLHLKKYIFCIKEEECVGNRLKQKVLPVGGILKHLLRTSLARRCVSRRNPIICDSRVALLCIYVEKWCWKYDSVT